MAIKPTFNTLNVKTNKQFKTITYNDKEIKVSQYLPVEQKIDLIQIALQKAEEDGIYNDIKLDVFFNMNIIYTYTDITFTDKQREDEYKLYDAFQSSGLLTQILAAIPEDELKSLIDYMNIMKSEILNYKNTAGAVLQSLIQDLPKNAQAAADIVNSFDETKYKQIIDLAQATGINNSTISTSKQE